MKTATMRLRALAPIPPQQLADLRAELPRPGAPSVEVSVSGDVLSFSCRTWEPMLGVRVEDALERLMGHAWQAVLVRA
jgi:hypothetical protein